MNFLKSAFVVSFCTLVSRFFGFIRDIFFAKYLGTSTFSDIFFTAFKLPNFFRNIFAEGAFNSAFVPVFASSLVKNDKKEIDSFLRNLFSILLYFLLIFTLLMEIAMPFVVKLIAPGFVSDTVKYSTSVILSRITFPYLIFISLVSFLTGILNSFGKFSIGAICPVILNITFIFFAILASKININIVYVLSYAVFIGGVLQFLWMFYFTVKHKILLYPVYPRFDIKIKEFFKKFINSFFASGIMQINSMVDAIMATFIVGAQSYIYYADRIFQLPMALIGTAISISILPTLSKQIELKNARQIDNTQELAIFTALFIGLPAGLGLFVMSDYMVPLLFQRGAFTALDSIAVISLLKIYAIGLPFSIIIKILQTIFYANKDTKTPVYTATISLILNIILNIILMRFFSYKGIVLSTIITIIINTGILLFILYKTNRIKFSTLFYINMLKLLYILITMFITMLLCNKYILPNTVNFLLQLIKLLLTIGISGIVYICMGFGLNVINKVLLKKYFKA